MVHERRFTEIEFVAWTAGGDASTGELALTLPSAGKVLLLFPRTAATPCQNIGMVYIRFCL